MSSTLHETLSSLTTLEVAMAAFYKACAQQWPEDADFWNGVAHQELAHACSVESMGALIELNPQHFTLARSFKVAAINTVIAGVNRNRELVSARQLLKRQALHSAYDIEKTVIERRFYELVETKDVRFLEIRNDIIEQTRKHQEQFERQIARSERRS